MFLNFNKSHVFWNIFYPYIYIFCLYLYKWIICPDRKNCRFFKLKINDTWSTQMHQSQKKIFINAHIILSEQYLKELYFINLQSQFSCSYRRPCVILIKFERLTFIRQTFVRRTVRRNKKYYYFYTGQSGVNNKTLVYAGHHNVGPSGVNRKSIVTPDNKTLGCPA